MRPDERGRGRLPRPFSGARRRFGLSGPAPLYPRVPSAWVLAFGAAYSRRGLTGRADRVARELGAWGKEVFVGQVAGEVFDP